MRSRNIPEVDAVVGTGELEKILGRCRSGGNARAIESVQYSDFERTNFEHHHLAARGRSSPRTRPLRAAISWDRRRRDLPN